MKWHLYCTIGIGAYYIETVDNEIDMVRAFNRHVKEYSKETPPRDHAPHVYAVPDGLGHGRYSATIIKHSKSFQVTGNHSEAATSSMDS